MRVEVLLHRTAELDDWPEKIREALEGKIQPLELEVKVLPTCGDLAFVEPSGDLSVAVLAPKKGRDALIIPVVERLISKNVRVFLAPFDEMPSLLEDFVAYLYHLLGIGEKE
ncbi:MAG: hypothetical protein GXO00_02265 [Candidatus Diapherotrites archaeon]|nr:hypothetical protein [Candidatus Diapherotrites archaeon]